VCDGQGRLIGLHLSAGQVSDYHGARALLGTLPKAKVLLADKGYDADWYRDALRHIGIVPCIPSRRNRKTQSAHDKTLYKQRHKIENAFGKIKDWRAVALRYHRHAHTVLSVITIAAIITFWL
jgi:transposase